jgi:hypothetical protein
MAIKYGHNLMAVLVLNLPKASLLGANICVQNRQMFGLYKLN